MIAFRDILIFAGLVALAAAIIASLFPVREGASPVPACSDCAFKLTGGYWIRQYGNYASLYLGTREAARYGWAHIDGFPLSIGEIVGCDPMYVHVLNGVAYVSCGDVNGSAFGRRVLPSAPRAVFISADPSKPGCTYTVDAAVNGSNTIKLEVYDENGKLVYSASGTSPATFTFNLPVAGTYRMHVYAPPLLDDWYTLYARISITASKAAIYTSNNTQDLRPSIALKIFDLTNYWKKGYASVKVSINPSNSYTLSAPAGAFADFLLAWEECPDCSTSRYYRDEVWRLTFTPSGPVLALIDHSDLAPLWHEVYADGKLIFVYHKDGPKNNRYTGSDPTITVEFASERPSMNARATFTKVCSWR
jgi:hypothetical protein